MHQLQYVGLVQCIKSYVYQGSYFCMKRRLINSSFMDIYFIVTYLQLPIKELKQNKRQKLEVKLYPQGSITLILEYFTSMASISRKPSMLSSGVFGVPIDVVAK